MYTSFYSLVCPEYMIQCLTFGSFWIKLLNKQMAKAKEHKSVPAMENRELVNKV